ncbi:MAG TPA: dihydroorotase [Pyrodictiaceae archaeon]|nr:dihydroorotase [Pyrodictiaceae archaeon]HIQ10841.1 dihydroorotase [Pyrodictium sp.]
MSRCCICGKLYDGIELRGEYACLVVDVESGSIVDVREKPLGCSEKHVYNSASTIITPSFIDMHVHLRGLSLAYKEDEETGTKAAIAGGIGLVVDMPNTSPYINTVELVITKLKALAQKSYTDYSLYTGLPKTIEQLKEIVLTGVAGLKLYPSDYYRVDEKAIEIVNEHGLIVIVHPELPEASKSITSFEECRQAHRSCAWEIASVKLLTSIATRNSRVHITHATCFKTIEEARNYGFTVDVTPHHLLNVSESYNYYLDCLAKVNPPLRDNVERGKLVKALLLNLVDAIASDHAPHSPKEKSYPYLVCPAGIASIEIWPRLLWRLVVERIMGADELLRLCVWGPASILGLDNLYGRFAPGYRGNIVVWEIGFERVDGLEYSKARYTPYWMFIAGGHVKAHYIGGKLVYNKHIGFITRPKTINPFERLKGHESEH